MVAVWKPIAVLMPYPEFPNRIPYDKSQVVEQIMNLRDEGMCVAEWITRPLIAQ